MSDATVLTVELLEELESWWTRQHVPLARTLAPGLSDAEMDELTEPLGLHLPPEARTWWGWHNGVQGTGSNEMAAPWRCISLQHALERTRYEREMASLDALPPDYRAQPVFEHWMLPADERLLDHDPSIAFSWSPNLVTFSEDSGGGQLGIDCLDQQPTSPLFSLDNEGRDVLVAAASIGTVVAYFIERFTAGQLEYRGDSTPDWFIDFDGIGPPRPGRPNLF